MTESDTEVQRVHTRSGQRLVLLSVSAAAVSAMLWAAGLVPSNPAGGPSMWVLLFGLFVCAEAVQLHLEVRRQTLSISLSEIPLVIGLFVIGPLGTLTMRLGALLLVMAVRRIPAQKALLNSCLVIFECSLAAALLEALFFGIVQDSRTWAAVLLAILVVNLLSCLLVFLAIGWTQGWLDRRQTAGMVISAVIAGMCNAVIGLLILIVLAANPQGLGLLLIVTLALIAMFRAYAGFVQQHRSLGQVYDFAQTVEAATVRDRGAYLTAEAVREMLNAERALLWLFPVGDVRATVAVAHADEADRPYAEPTAAGDPLRERVLRQGEGVLFRARGAVTDQELAALHARAATEAIGAPLRAASGLLGYLEVCDRRGDRLSFSVADVQLLESLATHVSAASQNVQLLRQLKYDASHDALTRLPNRVRLAEIIDAAQVESAGRIGVLVVDLDAFQDINDTLGHDAGDELLLAVSMRLITEGPEDATVGRTGGDEFAVLLPGVDVDRAEEQAAALLTAMATPFHVAGVAVEVSAAVGVAVAPQHGADPGALLQKATVALYAGRANGQPVTSYLPDMDERSLRRLLLGTQMREAMLGGQISVVFQPLIDIRTNELRCVETLARWQHPRYGPVPPDDFVQLAERIGMIHPLTMHILTLALRQCRDWLDRDIRIEVAVNLSARMLGDSTFSDRVADLLSTMDVPAELLTFEITESSVMADPETAVPVLHRLHELGIGLAIDDFGTGYSSLAYLRRLPVDQVKIDKYFVQSLNTDMGDAAITRAIIELAHSLSLTVVAEGVEDELTRDMLAGMKCDTIQGYLVSRPMTGARLDLWLAARTASRPTDAGVQGRRRYISAMGARPG